MTMRIPARQVPPRLHTPPTIAAPLTRAQRKSARKATRAAARVERANRPGARGWRRPGGGSVAWVEAPPEFRGTTVQVCGLWPFTAGSGTPTDGVPLGRHLLSGATVCGDPLFWFLAGRISNPSGFILGRPGLGKSSLARRIVNVSTGFGIIPLILADLKPDYPPLVRALGGQVIVVGRGRGYVNPLDPGPLAGDLHLLPVVARERVAAEQLARALNVLTGLLELVRGGRLTDREQTMLAAALRVLYADPDGRVPVMGDVLDLVASRHPRVRAVSLDRGDDDRYDDVTENLQTALMALCEDGQFGDTFARPTSVPMLLDRAVVFDVSAIDDAEIMLQAAVQLVCWSYGQSAVSAAKELAEAGLRPQQYYLMVMDELWRTLRASTEMVDRVDAITRLNRQKMLGQLLITHTMNDLKLSDATATAKAWGFVERSEMVFIGGLAPAEMGNLTQVFAMSTAETQMIAEWSTEGGFSSETGTQAVPPGRGKFLLKIGKNPGTPFEVELTATERDVNNTNRGWEQLRERHRTSLVALDKS
ncbi:hypothetical protein RHODO2019_18695 (plasmid) [Rhodococcus antarcticus]|uniref:ATP/GTP-binding protein n=1 Tax=Rhodococcus antarcticus TaxID=2987751 RepID=A0ABY6P6N7_9NOCA|nr:hypothetical protein [Rhodococcus antarcticus]UZJ27021.1 hypothetical protein RHODO2019_18695 [Rhodococcus antarcticus]